METATEQTTLVTEIGTALRHSAVYGLGNMLAKGVGFFMLPLYTHFLTAVDYGVLEILDLSMSLFGMFLAMGIIAALLRTYSRAQTEAQRRSVVSTASLFVIATGILTFAIGLCFLRPVSALILGPKIPPSYLLLSFASFILGYIAMVPRTYLRALDASGTFVAVDTITLFCLLGLNILFIAVLRIGLVGILLSSVLVFSVQCILLVAWTFKKAGWSFDSIELRRMLAFGTPLMFSNLAIFGLNFSDRFFLQHMRSLEVVGIYAVGYKLAFMLNYLLVQPFYVMWQSRMYVIQGRADHRDVFGQIFILYTIVLTSAGLALSVFSPEIVRVMAGPQFAASYDVVPLISLSYVLYGIGYYAQLGMFLTDKTKLVGMAGTGAAILNLVLNYVLVQQFGMMGAAWATMLSFLAIAIASYYFSERVYPLPLRAGRIVVVVALGISLYLPFRWLTDSPWTMLLPLKLIAVVAFPTLVWMFRILSTPETATVRSARDYAFSRLATLGRLIPARQTSR